jgi:hypothetical protein
MLKTRMEGRIVPVQLRIRLLRSFDQRRHNYPGYSPLIQRLNEQKPILIGPAAPASQPDTPP